MAATNKVAKQIHTHEGGAAKHLTPVQQLRRSVLSCLLFEKEFYEDGVSVTNRIAELVPKVDAAEVAKLAIEARDRMHLRHVPLFIVREMCRYPQHRKLVRKTLTLVVQRADELSEFLALYWKDARTPVAASVKKGLADALAKFSEYQLAKYDRAKAIKLRDVLRICHPKPLTRQQSVLYKKVIAGELATPDTWEVALSAGSDKKATWERLVLEKKLGGLALLRNLRNMQKADCSVVFLKKAILEMSTSRILPFRFIAAARYAPQLEMELQEVLFRSMTDNPKFVGRTVVLVDVSASMQDKLSAKSDMTRLDAACGVAMVLRERCEEVRVVTFSDKVLEVAARRGFGLRDAIVYSQEHSGTHLGKAVEVLKGNYDRLVVITDEQTADSVPDPAGKAYVINVASAKNGVGYGRWVHVDGFSEGVIDYIQQWELENGGLTA